jgi:hypothetical protein
MAACLGGLCGSKASIRVAPIEDSYTRDVLLKLQSGQIVNLKKDTVAGLYIPAHIALPPDIFDRLFTLSGSPVTYDNGDKQYNVTLKENIFATVHTNHIKTGQRRWLTFTLVELSGLDEEGKRPLTLSVLYSELRDKEYLGGLLGGKRRRKTQHRKHRKHKHKRRQNTHRKSRRSGLTT